MTKRIVCVCFVAFLAIFAVAMPSRSDLKKVQPTVNELMAEDISAMKSGKQTSEGAAAKAEELAGLATDEASKFLLLKGAFGLYVEGGKYEAAIAALEALKAQVKDVPDKVLADIVRAKMKKVSKKDGGAILSYYAQLDRRMRSAAEKTKLEKAVKDNPSDKDAHRQLALAKAVLDGWPAALAEFALAGGDIAAAAKAEQDGNVAAAADGGGRARARPATRTSKRSSGPMPRRSMRRRSRTASWTDSRRRSPRSASPSAAGLRRRRMRR